MRSSEPSLEISASVSAMMLKFDLGKEKEIFKGTKSQLKVHSDGV